MVALEVFCKDSRQGIFASWPWEHVGAVTPCVGVCCTLQTFVLGENEWFPVVVLFARCSFLWRVLFLHYCGAPAAGSEFSFAGVVSEGVLYVVFVFRFAVEHQAMTLSLMSLV